MTKQRKMKTLPPLVDIALLYDFFFA